MGNLQEKTIEKKDHNETFHIIVNGRPKEVTSEVLSFAEIVALAFPNAAPSPQTIFTVTFKNADANPSQGTLVAGETIKIKDGTIFNVTQTNQS